MIPTSTRASIKHLVAKDHAHAHAIVAAYVLQCGAATIEEGEHCLVLSSGFTVETGSMVTVITWEA